MEDNRIVDLYWQRNERAINETATKYGKYLHSISFATKTSGIYKYYEYLLDKKGSIINVSDNEHITDVMSHTYGKSGKTLSASKTTSFSYTTTQSWNAQIGCEVSEGLVKQSASAGYGVSTGWTCGSSVTKSAQLSEAEIKYAPTALYSLCAGRPHYKIRNEKKNWVTGNAVSTTSYYMPTGFTTIYTMKSTNNQDTWSIYS